LRPNWDHALSLAHPHGRVSYEWSSAVLNQRRPEPNDGIEIAVVIKRLVAEDDRLEALLGNDESATERVRGQAEGLWFALNACADAVGMLDGGKRGLEWWADRILDKHPWVDYPPED
jgi:hypothetical protein